MKKLLTLLLAVVMMLQMVLPVCAEGVSQQTPAETAETAESAGEETPEEPAEESTEETAEPSTEPSTEAPAEEPAEPSTEAPAEEPAEPSTEAPAEEPAEPSTEAPAEETAAFSSEDTVAVSVDDCSHGSLRFFEGYPATMQYNGVCPYWYCSDCKKYFRDDNGQPGAEFTEADSTGEVSDYGMPSFLVVPKLPAVSSGTTSDGFTWNLDGEGVLRISGTGEMRDYDPDSGSYEYRVDIPEWYQYQKATGSQVKKLILLEGITSVGENAFANMRYLTEAYLPDTLEKIGRSAFSECSGLIRIHIPKSVTSIDYGTFSGCSGLTSVTIPEGITRIEVDTFSNCSNLEKVYIPKSVTYISNAFDTSYNRPADIYYEGSEEDWANVSGYGSLSRSTLHYNTHMHSLIHNPAREATCTENGCPEYWYCESCQKSFGDAECTNELTEEQLVLPMLGHTMTKTEAVTPTSSTLGNNEYYTCTRCSRVFKDAEGMKETTVEAETLGKLSGSCGDNLTWALSNDGILTISGSGAMADYTGSLLEGATGSDAPWYPYQEQIHSVRVESGVTSIGNNAFFLCSSLQTVEIPESVTYIGDCAFMECSQLTGVTIPSGVTAVNDDVFYGCSSLTNVTIPEGVSSIGMGAFFGCTGLTSMEIPDSVTSIGSSAFAECEGLTSVVLSKNLTAISNSAFGSCTGLTDITIPTGVTSIGSFAFYNCTNLTSVKIPATVTSIDALAFNGCTALKDIYFDGSMDAFGKMFSAPDGVNVHSAYIANGTCGYSLTWVLSENGTLTISGSGEMYVPTYSCPWGEYTLKIRRIVIQPGVTSICYWAFNTFNDSYENLYSVEIPRSVTEIGGSAFHGCYNLRDISFGHRIGDTLSIASDAFDPNYYDGTIAQMVIRVPSTQAINPAIKEASFGWDSYRTIHYISTGDFPMEGIDVAPEGNVSEVELGIPITMDVMLEPADTTDVYMLSLVQEKTTADARISKDGILTTLSVGTVTVRAECVGRPELCSETTLEILPPTGTLTGVSVTTLNDYPGEATVGESVQMIPVFTPANAADRKVSWLVENGTGTATIDKNGVLTPLTVGTVTVYAIAANGLEGGCTVNIQRYADAVTILMDGHSDIDRLGIGEQVELSAVISPKDSTTKDVQWNLVCQTGVAALTVYQTDSYGRVSYSKLVGKQEGTVLLTATAKDSKQVLTQKILTVTDTIRSYALPDGSGNLYYNAESGWITGADDTVKNVVIPAQIDGVTIEKIAPYVFSKRDTFGNISENKTLSSVIIPASVTEIGEHAFDNCTALSALRFASGSQLQIIGDAAFYGCSKLTSLTIPNSVEQVGSYAFSNLTCLKNLTISGEWDTRGMFHGCYGLDTLTLTGTHVLEGECNENAYWSAFTERNAKKVILAESIRSIGDYAFLGCTGIEEVEVRGDLRSIGKGAFENCTGLTTINLPSSLKAIGKDCFQNCSKIQLLDLSKVPDTISVKETKLTNLVTVPENLIRGTGGKVSLDWSVSWQSDYNDSTPSPAYITWKDNNRKDQYLIAQSSGQITLYCRDSYTGAQGSKVVTIKTGNVIKPMDTGYLVSGSKLTLSLYREPEDKKDTNVNWYLADGDEDYASITYNGVLTAKNVQKAQQITVTAQPYNGSDTVMKSIWILPKTTGMSLELEKKPLDSTLDVDMFRSKTLNLSAKVQPEGALEEVKWSTSAASVAKVDENGVVTLVKPGKAVIKATAADGTKISAQVTLNVTYLDSSTKLTLKADVPSTGLQPGQIVQLNLWGTDEIPAEDVLFTVPANKAALGSVDETGFFTAGTTAGTVTVTAALRDDPLKRKASLNIKVIPMQAETVSLTAQLPDETGAVTEQVGEPLLILPAADLTSKYVFSLTAAALDYRGEALTPKVKWTSTDTAIATVDAKGTVTVKPKVSGQCAITATSTDQTKAQARFWISIRDYSPRLEANSLTLNLALTDGVSTGLVESYGNKVQSVSVNDSRFWVELEGNVLTLHAEDSTPKGNYKLTLRADCDDGKSYTYPLTVKAVTTLPKVTVKQTEKLNLFYRDSTASLTITPAGAALTYVELTGTEDFRLLCGEDGTYSLTRTDTDTAKPNTKATLYMELEGYSQPVVQNFTVSAGTTAPKLKLSATGNTLNSALTDDLTTELWLLDSANARVNLDEIDVSTLNDTADVVKNTDSFTVTLPAARTAKLTLLVQAENWTQSVKLTHTVTVAAKLPTLKPASAITLNAYFTQDEGSTEMVLSQKNLTLQDVTFTPLAKEGTKARQESDKLTLDFDPTTNTVKAYMTDANDPAAAGTYSFACTGTLGEYTTELSGGTLKVTVAKTLPKLRVSASTVRLNTALAGSEQAEITADLTGFAGCTLTGFQELNEGAYDGLVFVDGKLTFTLTDAAVKTYTYKLTPIVQRDGTEQEVTLPTQQTFKVTAYNGQKLSVSLSAKGKLDTLNPDSAIVYTVNKLTNCQGQITGLTLEGQDADKFHAELDNSGAKPQIRLTLNPNETYATNVTYKVRFSLTVCGQQVVSADQSLRVSQSTTKYAVTGNLTLYQSQTADLQAKLTLTSPVGVDIENVSLNAKTPRAFLDAIGGESGFYVTYDGSAAALRFASAAPGKLKAGTYTVLLDVFPKGNAENVKPTTVKLTVKVKK